MGWHAESACDNLCLNQSSKQGIKLISSKVTVTIASRSHNMTDPQSSKPTSTNQPQNLIKTHPWFPLIMWGSMLLMTMSTVVIAVLHSAGVVHISHESWSSLLAAYPLYKQAPLLTSGVCARASLQVCSMVSPSLQCTRWGFTGGVSLDHQGPPLAPCGSQESPLLHPLIPNQVDPKRVHSICTTDWYAKLGSTTYYTRLYRYRLMVVLFLWVIVPWTGP
jgi:hypothetical protein